MAGVRLLELRGYQGLHQEQQHRQALHRNAFVGHMNRKNPAARDCSSPNRSCQPPSSAARPDPYPSRRTKPARAALQSRSIWPGSVVSCLNDTSFQFLCISRASLGHRKSTAYRARTRNRPQIAMKSSIEFPVLRIAPTFQFQSTRTNKWQYCRSIYSTAMHEVCHIQAPIHRSNFHPS